MNDYLGKCLVDLKTLGINVFSMFQRSAFQDDFLW